MKLKLYAKFILMNFLWIITRSKKFYLKKDKYSRFLYCFNNLKKDVSNNNWFVIGDSHTDIFSSKFYRKRLKADRKVEYRILFCKFVEELVK